MFDKIIEIIAEITGFEDRDVIATADLLEDGILDSMSFVTLIDTLEEEFFIEVQPTTVPPETWRSAPAIAALVERRLRGAVKEQ